MMPALLSFSFTLHKYSTGGAGGVKPPVVQRLRQKRAHHPLTSLHMQRY